MRVILLKDIKKIGKEYEIKQVANGYGRNYLIPNGLAKLATENNLRKIQHLKNAQLKAREIKLKKMQNLASQLKGLEVKIPANVAPGGELFGSVGTADISQKLKELNFAVNEDQIKLENPIKKCGKFPVEIQLPYGIRTKITVSVIERLRDEEMKRLRD